MSGHTAHSGTRHPHTGAKVQRLAAEVESHIIAHRRALHAIPETGFEERCTAAYVAETLSGLGLPVRTGIAATAIRLFLNEIHRQRGTMPTERAI